MKFIYTKVEQVTTLVVSLKIKNILNVGSVEKLMVLLENMGFLNI